MTNDNKNFFYKNFEELFYAPRSHIKELRKQYLEFITPISDIYENGKIFDIGCGRGEWLELMQEQGFSVLGVDLDPGMLESCHENGLNAKQGNAIEYLKQIESDSQVVVTAFHVVEHISFSELQALVQESLRVLRPGGLLILETPNPENIRVATENFYYDPTHIKPIPIKLLAFIPEYYGYYRIKVLRLHEPKELHRKEYPALADVLEGVSIDYAVIAQKESCQDILKKFDTLFVQKSGLSFRVLADRFENRLFSIEQRCHESEKRSVAAEKRSVAAEKRSVVAENNAETGWQQYYSVVNSNSWKSTKILRLLRKYSRWFFVGCYHWLTFSPTSRPRRKVKEKLLDLKYWIISNPDLKAKVGKWYPLVPDFIKSKLTYLTNRETLEDSFKCFQLGNRVLHFSLLPLEDRRGIGRVTREQLKYVESKLTILFAAVEKQDEVYFYSSIHWCPDVLPDNCVVMIHDVIPLVLKEYFPDEKRVWTTKFKSIAKQAKHIITISQTSKNDIVKYLEISPDKITIINNGVCGAASVKRVSGNLPEDFFVYLGSYDKHKNLDVVLKAMATPECSSYHLIMIGNNFESKAAVKKLKIEERVHFLGVLEDEEIAWVMTKSLALLFPSLYEGFGLPPMEAALLKKPSICSRRPAMTELLDGVSLFADPYDVHGWARQMRKLASDDSLKERLSRSAYARVSRFSWELAGARLLKIISLVSSTE